MADTVNDVRDKIESDAESHGWDDDKITAYLGDGKTANRIAAIYWNRRAQETLYLVNVSESGSSRSLDQVYPRMVEMANMYTRLADAEDDSGPSETSTRFVRSHPIERL